MAIILGFLSATCVTKLQALNTQNRKNWRFSTVIAVYLGHKTKQAYSYYESLI